MSTVVQNAYNAPDDDEIKLPSQPWDDSFAAKIVMQDFDVAQNYRSQNHDWRWRKNEQDYVGWRNQKYWEGTRVPRANLPMHVILEQVEALLPRLLSALFQEDPWFEALPEQGTSPEAAQAIRDIIVAQLHSRYCPTREVFRRGIKSQLLYGNGIYSVEWLYLDQEILRFAPEFRPKHKTIAHPMTGQPIVVPTGEIERRVKEFKDRKVINQPLVRWVSLFDFYIDPNCPGPIASEARYIIHRTLVPIDSVMALSKKDGFTIPDREWLEQAAKNKRTVDGDITKGYTESARLGTWQPTIDMTADPAGQRLELLKYVTADRLVWAITTGSGPIVLFNKPNPDGRINYYSSFHTDLIDRFYAMGMGDILEGEQELQAGIINARLDELALSIHTPTVHKAGRAMPPYKMRIRPGANIPAENPRDDFIPIFPQNVTQQAFAEVQASDIRSQKKTGVSDMAMLGVATAQNPAARTATGASAQAQASYSRAQYHIENIEVNVMEPILEAIHAMNQKYLDPNQIITALDGRQVDPIQIFGQDVKFQMRAASRMRSAAQLLQVFPFIAQYTMNPALLQQLAIQGMTVDYAALFKMLTDATGYRTRATLVRPMTPQEQQAAQQKAQQMPPEAMLKLQMQRERMADMKEMKGDQFELDTVKDLVLEAARKQTDEDLREEGDDVGT